MVTQDDDRLVRIELLMGSGGDFAHRHQGGVGETRNLKLPGFADVQKEGVGSRLTLCGELFDADLGRKHTKRISRTSREAAEG